MSITMGEQLRRAQDALVVERVKFYDARDALRKEMQDRLELEQRAFLLERERDDLANECRGLKFIFLLIGVILMVMALN